VGLRYDRWKLGIGDGSEWLRFNSFRKDSSLDYRWLDTHRYSLSLSLQLHTLTGGEGSDAPESGPHTLRGRAIGSMDPLPGAWEPTHCMMASPAGGRA
jgi:hypothetical protein